ncbi:MAG: hypothetical protein KC684_02075 [Candidatus Omnitrophica bacterium]|nr:hypothetical protein [Candidatus Omnitrophota bacterium]
MKYYAIVLGCAVFLMTGFSSHARADVNPQVRELVEQYVQQMIYSSLMETTSDIIQRAIEQNNLAVLPPVAVQAMQQAVLQCFKQGSTQEIIRTAYEEARDLGIEQIENGLPQDQIQTNIKRYIDGEMTGVTSEFIYQKIIEEVLKQSLKQTRQVMMMQMTQRQAQMAAIQQRQRVIQQAIVEQYQRAIQQQFSAQINQQLQGAYQQQYNQLKQQEAVYRQRVEQQYQSYMQDQYQQQLSRPAGSGVY